MDLSTDSSNRWLVAIKVGCFLFVCVFVCLFGWLVGSLLSLLRLFVIVGWCFFGVFFFSTIARPSDAHSHALSLENRSLLDRIFKSHVHLKRLEKYKPRTLDLIISSL
jgi:hypothetical protein